MAPTTSQIDYPSELGSTLMNGLIIAAIIVGCATLSAAIWKAGCYFGRPIGNMIVRVMPIDPQNGPKRTDEQRANAQRALSGIVASFLCFTAVMVEFCLLDQSPVPNTWDRLVLVFAKGCFEGLIADLVLAQVVKVLGMAGAGSSASGTREAAKPLTG